MSEVKSIYELLETDYISLSESGYGKIIYGDDFPPNLSVFKTEKAKYIAVGSLYYLVKNITEDCGCSAAQVVELITRYGVDLGELADDIEKGLISDDDIASVINDVDG